MTTNPNTEHESLFPPGWSIVPKHRCKWTKEEEQVWFRRLRVAEACAAQVTDSIWQNRLTLTKDIIASHHIPLVYYLAVDIANSSANPLWDEVISAGQLGLTRAINRFDAARGFRFNTYAHSAISNAMINALREGKNPRRAARVDSEKFDSLEACNDAYSATSRIEMVEWVEDLRWAMDNAGLDAAERLVLYERFTEGKTLSQICEEQGHGKSWASRVSNSAMSKLRLALKTGMSATTREAA